jgi:molybdopterin molybdotransferase
LDRELRSLGRSSRPGLCFGGYEERMSERVLEFGEALATVLQHASALPQTDAAERGSLTDAAGRTLAAPVRAHRDQPPFDRSTRDGFAVRSGDIASGGVLQVVGSVRAGEAWSGAALRSGQAVEIMTGAPVPAGADAVLMVEHAVRGEDGMLRPHPERRLQPGENVVQRGAEACAGDEVIPRGRRVGAAEIALAAACGHTHLELAPQPEVAIVATGDELVELGTEPAAWQIYNSNSYALAALVSGEGARPQRLPVARDELSHLRELLQKSRKPDLMLLSGGVSMGKYDLVEQALAEMGAEFFFTGAKIQPGKPVVFGRVKGQGSGIRDQGLDKQEWVYFFGLPGNPISTEVCFRLFVAPLLRALAGQMEVAPRFVEARLAGEVSGGSRVTRFLPAVLSGDWQGVTARIVPWQGSGDLAANARANGFVVLPSGVERLAAGETVRVLPR